jgi:hypothetical protein
VHYLHPSLSEAKVRALDQRAAAVTGSRHHIGATETSIFESVLGKFSDDLLKLCKRNFWGFFAQGRQCRQIFANGRKYRP